VRVESPVGELGMFLMEGQSVSHEDGQSLPQVFINLQILPPLVRIESSRRASLAYLASLSTHQQGNREQRDRKPKAL